MPLDLKQITLESLSDIRYSFWTGTHPGWWEIGNRAYNKNILVVRFEGSCRDSRDTTFMRSMGEAGVHAFASDAIIIDLSAVSYEWGDEMVSVFGIGGDLKPKALVVGEKCRKAIQTLCSYIRSDQKWISETLDAAWNYVTKLLDEGETPPIHKAASSGDFQRVKELIESGEDPNRTDLSMQTPLHRASDPSIVKLLIDAGANVKAKDKSSWTPLHRVKNIECARLLLNAGADPDARSWENLSPLGHVGSAEIAKLLIEAGADVHLRRRRSLLHNRPRPEIAKLLIDAGVDVNGLDQNGQTPLDIAQAQRNHNLVAVLRANGAKHGPKADLGDFPYGDDRCEPPASEE